MPLQAADFTTQDIKTVFRFLSQDRIQSYYKHPKDTHETLLGRYFWNISLCEACYPALSLLEVTLRNQIDDVLSTTIGTNWLHENSKILKSAECVEIEKAKNRIVKKKLKTNSNYHSELIATLTLGFWTSLFRNEYAPLWHKHLKTLFPYLLARYRTPKYIFEQLRHIRDFRNRVFHHEPIWHWQNLLERYKEIVFTLSWFSPTLKKALGQVDRFETIYKKGPISFNITHNLIQPFLYS